MKELTAQIIKVDGLHCFRPYTLEDADNSKEYRLNQIVEIKVKGVNPVAERSIQQLNSFWKGCKIVADNSDSENWNTKDKVAFQVKVALGFIDQDRTIVTPDGKVCFFYRSIAVKNLKHLDACRFFDRAFDILSEAIGVDRDKFMGVVLSGSYDIS